MNRNYAKQSSQPPHRIRIRQITQENPIATSCAHLCFYAHRSPQTEPGGVSMFQPLRATAFLEYTTTTC